MIIISYIILFILWSVFGSFGSVLIRRLRNWVDSKMVKSILYWRSVCPNCQNILTSFDLFPIFSWLFLWWKCSHCKSKIPFFYFLLELSSWIVFIMSFWIITHIMQVDFTSVYFLLNLFFLITINWVLLLLLFADLLFFELNIFIWLFWVLLAIFMQFFWLVGDFKIAFLWAILFCGMFYFIYYFAKFYVKIRFWYSNTEWFWLWDVMVWLLIGLTLPFILKYNSMDFDSVYKIMLMYIFLSSLFWILFAIWKYIFTKGKYGQAIPFLPAMIVAYWILFIFANFFLQLFDLF